MKILVVGSGAREHALCETLLKSKKNPEIINFGDTRNPGIAKLAKKIEIADPLDFVNLKTFAKAEKPDFAVLGPDDPIGAGVADALLEVGVPSVGPTRSLARLESSKSFARKLLTKYEIVGNPKYKTFFSDEGLEDFMKECREFVVKFDGLAGGKGVQVQGDHFKTLQEGLAYAKQCLEKSGKVLIEEKLTGEEFSLLFFVDGESVVPMPVVQDNKRAFTGDKGPNTGGMGSISDMDHLLPFLTKRDIDQARDIAVKTIGALQADCGDKFKGILFGGFMATASGVKVVEFNVRFGDPEALNLLPILATDLVDICQAILAGKLAELNIEFLEQATVCKYVVPAGYPLDPVKNAPIEFDPKKVPEGVKVYYRSLDIIEGQMIMGSSRSIAFVGIADSLAEAQYLAEEATKSVSGQVFHREDIGTSKQISERAARMKALRGS